MWLKRSGPSHPVYPAGGNTASEVKGCIEHVFSAADLCSHSQIEVRVSSSLEVEGLIL